MSEFNALRSSCDYLGTWPSRGASSFTIAFPAPGGQQTGEGVDKGRVGVRDWPDGGAGLQRDHASAVVTENPRENMQGWGEEERGRSTAEKGVEGNSSSSTASRQDGPQHPPSQDLDRPLTCLVDGREVRMSAKEWEEYEAKLQGE
ncbi:hypothetical protein JCM10213_007630 [Rhodosporidiobolus nylandii]